MRFDKATLAAEGWRPRAVEPEPVKVIEQPEPVPSTAEQLAPMLAEIARALKTKPHPVVIPAPATATGWRITVNRNQTTDLIESFDLTRLE